LDWKRDTSALKPGDAHAARPASSKGIAASLKVRERTDLNAVMVATPNYSCAQNTREPARSLKKQAVIDSVFCKGDGLNEDLTIASFN
jgi:hypothetical protein